MIMSNIIRVALAGEGAIGTAHLEALRHIAGIEVVLLIGGVEETTRRVAEKFGIKKWTTDFNQALSSYEFEAIILATPTPMHAAQAIQCMKAGRHVLVEIPMADSLAESRALVEMQRATGLVVAAGHLRRFNFGHAWMHKRIRQGKLTLRQMVTQTYFLRRTNINLQGEPRSWTDSLLWHHACHSVDLFLFQTGEAVTHARALAGPLSPSLGIPLDMSIQLKTRSDVLASTSLSFNNAGTPGSVFRYICDEDTFIVKNDEIVDSKGEAVKMENDAAAKSGLQAADQNFFDAIRGVAKPIARIEDCLPAMEVLDRLERDISQD
jgi:2-hydroxy-4-carboxymuconate semialdehyde hemiacetal dehydrogenase